MQSEVDGSISREMNVRDFGNTLVCIQWCRDQHACTQFLIPLLVQKDLIEPALNGTRNVLGSVAKNKSTVKRTVVTSSFAGAVYLIHFLLPAHLSLKTPMMFEDDRIFNNRDFQLQFRLGKSISSFLTREHNLNRAIQHEEVLPIILCITLARRLLRLLDAVLSDLVSSDLS